MPANTTQKEYPNDDKYVGPVNSDGKDDLCSEYLTLIGERHGKGKYIFSNGDVYEGEFRHNIAVGQGVFIQVNGESYKGEFKNQKYDGKGICTYQGGDTYEGEFVGTVIIITNCVLHIITDGLRDGSGIYRHAAGNVYEGTFKKGKIDGKGKYTYINGDWYEVSTLAKYFSL
jgi:hypothetical protein